MMLLVPMSLLPSNMSFCIEMNEPVVDKRMASLGFEKGKNQGGTKIPASQPSNRQRPLLVPPEFLGTDEKSGKRALPRLNYISLYPAM